MKTLLLIFTALTANAQNYRGVTNTFTGLSGSTNSVFAANVKSNFNAAVNVDKSTTAQLQFSYSLMSSNPGGVTFRYVTGLTPYQYQTVTNSVHFPADGTNTACLISNISLNGAQWFKLLDGTNTTASVVTNATLVLGYKVGL